jgi:hypothetical protein
MLITPEYQVLNEQLHASNPNYGVSSLETNKMIYDLVKSCRYESIVDYGAGKRNLEYYVMNKLLNDKDVDWKPTFTSYDPAVPEVSKLPTPADLVVCTDVLEHVEPECLKPVLSRIVFCAKKAILLKICLVQAKKTLPDGRNAHLIQQKAQWWITKINPLTNIVSLYHPTPNHLIIICKSS